ncbi:hypothetical protein BDZ85DRAFT_296038 [Elsinoe ampelina]|uniref:BTB domain-containing protein n=1 Tax=Elsinoe ampelina TaxID=302913 RepID=A0A6A6GDU3_9PEZI|nr:hypothetical protein BDZ85DRAFT_296038 [Elsinoe ampelina]
MADPEVVVDASANGEDDVEMIGEDGAEENGDTMGGLENIETEVPAVQSFADYLRSPLVEIVVGKGDEAISLYSHKLLLQKSSFLGDLIQSRESEQGDRIISLDEDVAAVSSALEFLYRNDYFPALATNQSLENDPTVPKPDTSGIALLRHARVYTLAKALNLPQLATLAHRKIHLVESTARGEIAYARYVYGHTSEEEKEIRKPVAQFWATRSHVLRHEAEKEFREMCLSYPQFGFDVLSMVLDAQEKRTGKSESVTTGRKRARMSQG